MPTEASVLPSPCYDPGAYPYFFKDTDSDGACSITERVASNAYATWTPALMKAAHNYQLWSKEPGAFAHNFNYMGELLYDSAEALSKQIALDVEQTRLALR